MINKGDVLLHYDISKWRESDVRPTKTLQVFITNRCNLRCKGCFYAHGLSSTEMSVDEYRELLFAHKGTFDKVLLLGGEPLLHRDLKDLLEINSLVGVKTTLYTNGKYLERCRDLPLENVDVRVGVYGLERSEKPLNNVPRLDDIPYKVVYMLRRDNVDELYTAAKSVEYDHHKTSFYVSSIRDITATRDYWSDTDDTLSINEYADVVQRFINEHDGGLKKLELATRGVLVTHNQTFCSTTTCRFENVFIGGQRIRCPFDIGVKKYTNDVMFGNHRCNKHSKCILQKIVLERIEK